MAAPRKNASAKKKRTAKSKSIAENQCPLTTSTKKRAAADKLAASVQDGFPAGLSQPALRALAAAGYKNLAQLTKVRAADLGKLHGMGPKGIRILQEALKARGTSLLK